MGLRPPHYPFIFEHRPQVDFFEAVTENFMDTAGRPIRMLEKIRERHQLFLHGVSLSIGSADELDFAYLEGLRTLVNRFEPAIVSDHLCWTGVGKLNTHDLLPLPWTNEALGHVVDKVRRVQDLLGRRIVLENVSSYVGYAASEMTEWEFLREVATQADCGILFDVNNLYVNAFNHRFDPLEYVRTIPAERVAYVHLAGHTDRGNYYFDTHDGPVIEKVWDLYREVIRQMGPLNTVIEWDAQIPAFPVLAAESARARQIEEEVLGDRSRRAVA